MSARGKRIRGWVVFLTVLLVLGGASAGVYHMRKAQASVAFPVAPARKGDFLVLIRARGELKAARSVQVYAPVVPQLRIAWLAPSGAMIHQGDLMIKFDSSASEQQLQQKDAALRQAQATLDQAVAQSKITADQDKSDFADAQFNVEKAKLEVSKQEIVGELQAAESRIDLGLREQKLKVAQATADLHAASDRSRIGSLTRVRDYNQNDVDITKQRISQMEIKAPITGFLSFFMNYSQGWMNAKPFKVGDNVWAGMSLAEIPDLDTLQMEGKIEEIDRGRISVNMDVRVHVDSLPELSIPARIGQISPLAEATVNEYPPTRSFKAWAPIPHPDPRLRTGMNSGMDIVINRVPNAISIPAKALFTHDGKPVVFVADGGRYRTVEVQLLARNPDEVAVSGIPAGAMVTLVDVEKKENKR
jgi:multidrug efflux pump subunit AcrA (membrane-fusion protein)